MNKVYLVQILMSFFYTVHAQSNLEIINYFEAIKIISKTSYKFEDIPVIAIIDKGINLEHEDLKENIWVNRHEIPENGLDDDKNGFVDDVYGWNFNNNTNDIQINGVGNWHGTPVNGIIGANCNNNIGVKGICPKVKLMNIVKGESITSIINSLQYVYEMRKIYNETNGQQGAFIVAVNCSWGKDSLWASEYPEWCNLYDSLGSVGVLSVHAAPNDNTDIDAYGDMPATCESEYLIVATNSNKYDKKVYDAGYGRYSVDIAAPGDNTYTTLNTGGYGYFSGTSAAAPYVAGVIGLLYLLPSVDFQQFVKQNPSEAAAIIKSVIINGVENIPEFANNTISGGRLNAFGSIKLLCERFNTEYLYENLFEKLKIVSVYPNPAISTTTLFTETNAVMQLTIAITDIMGRIVYTKNVGTKKGFNSISVNITGIPKGFYIINLSSGRRIESIKLSIQ